MLELPQHVHLSVLLPCRSSCRNKLICHRCSLVAAAARSGRGHAHLISRRLCSRASASGRALALVPGLPRLDLPATERQGASCEETVCVCMFHHVDAGVRFSGQPAFLGTEVAALHRAHTSGFSSALQQLSHILPRIAVPLG
jgi:hypothetical protein